ncbi:MAG: hypothetical protein EOO14_25170, partial [Chitinophagaceae bacterium]
MRIVYAGLLALCLVSLNESNAQARAATFSFSYHTMPDGTDFGPQLTDGEAGIPDVPGVTYEWFYSDASGNVDGTVRFWGYGNHGGDNNNTFFDGRDGYIYPSGQQGGTPPYQAVFQTADGSEFSFKSIYLANYTGAIAADQTLEIVAYRNGDVLGQITAHADNGQFGLLVSQSNLLTPAIFENVDKIVIRPTVGSAFSSAFWYGLNEIVVDNAVNTVLPLRFSSFTARKEAAGSVWLNWKTADEKEAAHFVVERSADGKTFLPIGSVRARGEETSDYAFQDNLPMSGKNYYRLAQHDLYGGISYSVVQYIGVDSKGRVAAYPNPVLASSPIAIKTNLTGPVEVMVTNTAGQ